ncbi:hypothetical protein ALC57_18686 [Trachymyrmex cornetzi]|uniref:Uncharacterized protein n=1 Tax=Trachymyrmex cornetzi TaxID=471704 RepID=A0A151IRC4_9HYME|nr:hypothetical protein ALC57_18686 [Trachymyrmex cornetzi]
MAPSYAPLRVKQLLSETFLSTGFSFRDIWLDHLKWDTLYMCLLDYNSHSQFIKVLYQTLYIKNMYYKCNKLCKSNTYYKCYKFV